MIGKWVISADMEDVTIGDGGLDLQTMIDAIPAEGGEIFIANGVYELSEPLNIPDTVGGKITITGCTFKGADKPRTVHPGTVHIKGKLDKKFYWSGSVWKATVEDALSFETKEAAEDVAFEFISKNPRFLALLEIVQVGA